jgi:hypothetical protein
MAVIGDIVAMGGKHVPFHVASDYCSFKVSAPVSLGLVRWHVNIKIMHRICKLLLPAVFNCCW